MREQQVYPRLAEVLKREREQWDHQRLAEVLKREREQWDHQRLAEVWMGEQQDNPMLAEVLMREQIPLLSLSLQHLSQPRVNLLLSHNTSVNLG
jgi:hypothetical protein